MQMYPFYSKFLLLFQASVSKRVRVLPDWLVKAQLNTSACETKPLTDAPKKKGRNKEKTKPAPAKATRTKPTPRKRATKGVVDFLSESEEEEDGRFLLNQNPAKSPQRNSSPLKGHNTESEKENVGSNATTPSKSSDEVISPYKAIDSETSANSPQKKSNKLHYMSDSDEDQAFNSMFNVTKHQMSDSESVEQSPQKPPPTAAKRRAVPSLADAPPAKRAAVRDEIAPGNSRPPDDPPQSSSTTATQQKPENNRRKSCPYGASCYRWVNPLWTKIFFLRFSGHNLR